MTNRSTTLLPKWLGGVDGRSTWVRRLHDLIALHLSDLGGEDNVSEAEKRIVRRAATIEVECERMEHKFAQDGEASASDLDRYQRASNTLRRHLETLGIARRARDVTEDVYTYMARRQAEKAKRAATATDGQPKKTEEVR